MITTRDGIVGQWNLPGGTPVQHDSENATNLERWEPRVRAILYDFELVSRLGFSAVPAPGGPPGARTITIWHLEVAAGGAAPSATYVPLIRFDRPPETVFRQQLQFLRSYADLRPDRATEIVGQMPSLVPFLASIGFLRPDAKRWTMELLEVVLQLARFVEHRIKHGLACRRPNEYSAQVQPIILTPGHGSGPSGHATEAFAAALVFWLLLRAARTGSVLPIPLPPYQDDSYGIQFMRLASRIAINRTVAGVHFPIDSVMGALLGLTLGEYFVARVATNTYEPAHFDGTVVAPTGVQIGDRDFAWPDIYDVPTRTVKFDPGPGNPHPCVRQFTPGANTQTIAANGSPPLGWLWGKAVAEWT